MSKHKVMIVFSEIYCESQFNIITVEINFDFPQ